VVLLELGGAGLKVFGKVMIANRGEIAVRVIRALKEMGLPSVAVYSDADREALHTRLADEAYHIGPTPALESYLDIEGLIEATKRSGAEAIHPGYGFLAESAPFAQAVTEAGLVWIGPHPGAIEAMGSKVASRRIMARAGVPITPGTEVPIGSPEEILAFTVTGYPCSAAGARASPWPRTRRRPKQPTQGPAERVRLTSATGRCTWKNTFHPRGISRYKS
jgi:acetyl/propionyl-CoA carboxylase alpha subunit